MDENKNQARQTKAKPVVITLDGNIGAGKSTLLEEVRKACPEFEVCTEPVGEWMTIQDENGKSLVELFYEDKMRWAYTFQNLTILTRLKAIRDVLRTTNKQVVIMERSVLTDRYVFAELMKDDGAIDQLEYQLYLKWFDQFATELPLKGMIHVTTDVNLASTRIAKRGRDGEDNIPTEYLNALDKQHEKWLSTTDLPLLQLSTDDDVNPEDNIKKIREWVNKTYFPQGQTETVGEKVSAKEFGLLNTPAAAPEAFTAVTL